MAELPAHDIGMAATRFHRAMAHTVQNALDAFGLTGQQYGALVFISRNTGTSNADLARFLMITPQALGRVTADLQRRGFLERRPEETDGRRRPLSSTRAGEDLLRRAEPVVEEAQRLLLSPLTTDEQAAFRRALDLCTDSHDRSERTFDDLAE